MSYTRLFIQDSKENENILLKNSNDYKSYFSYIKRYLKMRMLKLQYQQKGNNKGKKNFIHS